MSFSHYGLFLCIYLLVEEDRSFNVSFYVSLHDRRLIVGLELFDSAQFNNTVRYFKFSIQFPWTRFRSRYELVQLNLC